MIIPDQRRGGVVLESVLYKEVDWEMAEEVVKEVGVEVVEEFDEGFKLVGVMKVLVLKVIMEVKEFMEMMMYEGVDRR